MWLAAVGADPLRPGGLIGRAPTAATHRMGGWQRKMSEGRKLVSRGSRVGTGGGVGAVKPQFTHVNVWDLCMV